MSRKELHDQSNIFLTNKLIAPKKKYEESLPQARHNYAQYVTRYARVKLNKLAFM